MDDYYDETFSAGCDLDALYEATHLTHRYTDDEDDDEVEEYWDDDEGCYMMRPYSFC